MSALQAGEGGAPPEPLPLRRILGVRIAGELYGIAIEHIAEIVKLPPVTFVPGAPRHILGVSSLRGQIVPVINMRLILGLESTRADHPGQANIGSRDKPRIVVVQHSDILVGILVDSVTEVYDLRAQLEAPLGGPASRFQIKEGYLRLGNHMLTLLHMPTFFSRLTES